VELYLYSPRHGVEGNSHHLYLISVMELGHLLARSGLTCPEVFPKEREQFYPFVKAGCDIKC
jgi:hypothetical protein